MCPDMHDLISKSIRIQQNMHIIKTIVAVMLSFFGDSLICGALQNLALTQAHHSGYAVWKKRCLMRSSNRMLSLLDLGDISTRRSKTTSVSFTTVYPGPTDLWQCLAYSRCSINDFLKSFVYLAAPGLSFSTQNLRFLLHADSLITACKLLVPHTGFSSLTWNRTQSPCIGTSES